MYSQNSVLTDFRFWNFGHFWALFGNTYSATFRQYCRIYAELCPIFGTIRHFSATLGTFRHFSAFFGNNSGEHPFIGQPNSLACAPGFLDCHRIANCINK